MMKSMLRCFRAGLVIQRAADVRRMSVQLVRIEALRLLLRGVQLARSGVMGLVLMLLLVGLIGLGAVLLHAAGFLLLPFALKTKAFIALGLGFLYLILGMVILRGALDENTWIRRSGVPSMLADLQRPPE